LACRLDRLDKHLQLNHLSHHRNDTLTGNGGIDVFNAGVGNDTIIINASNITTLEQTGTGKYWRHYECKHHK
jgi:Ca2+-binding RTX toxin-like protein